jgi:hypothetical protein
MSLSVQLLNEQMAPYTLKTSRLREKVNQPKHNHRLNNSEINKTELGGVHDSRELNSMNKDG